MSAIARALVLVLALASGCARVHVRRAALEELAATVAAGIASHAGQAPHSAARPCPSR
jgi:hypothetical protein